MADIQTLNQSSRKEREMDEAKRVMHEIGMQLIAEKKTLLRAQAHSAGSGESMSRKDIQGRDLLTLLIKANMANDIPEEQRLTDEEILARKRL